jgi:hypothetical protein
MFTRIGFEIAHGLVFYLKSLEMNDPNEFICGLPDLTLSKF